MALTLTRKEIVSTFGGGALLSLPIEPQAPEVMQIENDLIVLSLDDRYEVSFQRTAQKEDGDNKLKDVPPKKEEDSDMMEIDDVLKTGPLEGMARYALTVLMSCDGECFQSSPAQLITDSLRFVFVVFVPPYHHHQV